MLALLLLAGPAAARPRQVPFGFLGMMVDGVLLDPKIPLDAEMTQMVRTGVESVRIGVYWSVTQPYANAAAGARRPEPPSTRSSTAFPTNWSASDTLYAAAAAHGLRVLPVILQAPSLGPRQSSPDVVAAGQRTAYGDVRRPRRSALRAERHLLGRPTRR